LKKKAIFKVAIASMVGLASLTPLSFAHDNLEGGHKGRIYDDNLEDTSGITVLEGSKNVKYLKEVAAVGLKELGGKKMTSADVYGHKGYAYVGTHTGIYGTNNGGVRVFDLKDPSNPVEVSVFANDLPGTSWQEKVIVKSVSTPHFKGDLAVVSVQKTSRVDTNSKGGFALYDVTTPTEPKYLGFYETPSNVRGTHELYLTTQGNRALVLTASSYSDYFTKGESKDVDIVDVSDPGNPTKIASIDPRSTGVLPEDFNGYHWKDQHGKQRAVFAHSVITDENGTHAYVSFWDLGTAIFDIRDPENPKYLGRTDFDGNVQGHAHSAALAKGGTILIETREVYQPLKPGYDPGFGYTRIFDIKDKSNPKLLSTFRTENSQNVDDYNESDFTFAYTVHDPKVRGNTLYLSHYADGVRILDITNPSNPKEIGSYVPERADIWGVFVDRNYILASDLGLGLKVLQVNNSKSGRQSLE